MKQKENVNEMVFNKIAERILSQEWAPGMKITPENQLAQELGVSRMSVREAIEKMVALDILSKKRGEGTFVNKLNSSIQLNNLIPMVMLEKTDIFEILEFRKIIEVDSARLCAERCGNDIIEKLQECYEKMYEKSNSGIEFSYIDFNFHKLIAEGSGNSLIIKINSILTNILKFQQANTNESLGPVSGLNEHKNIFEAIKNKDPELAAIYMRRHIEITMDKMQKILSEKA